MKNSENADVDYLTWLSFQILGPR